MGLLGVEVEVVFFDVTTLPFAKSTGRTGLSIIDRSK